LPINLHTSVIHIDWSVNTFEHLDSVKLFACHLVTPICQASLPAMEQEQYRYLMTTADDDGKGES
jgi:hypothetical protein